MRNVGPGPSGPTTLRYYRLSGATIKPVGTDTVSGLDASSSDVQTIELTAPGDPGAYHFIVCADSVPGETNDGDNCSGPVSITVTATTIGTAADAGPGLGNPDVPIGDDTEPTPALPPDSYSVGIALGRTGIHERTIATHVFSVNGLSQDSDPSTVDFTMRADVKDDRGRDDNDCEQDGMGVSRTIMVVDEEVETFAITFGNADGSCIIGEYTIEAVFDDGVTQRTVKTAFTVVGGDVANIEVQEGNNPGEIP